MKHYRNKDLFCSSCTYDWLCNINIQLRSGWTTFFPFNCLDYRLKRTCRRANLPKVQVFPFWDSSSRRYVYNLVTKEKYSDKPDLQTLATTLQNMQAHATMHGVSTIALAKIGCGLDQMNWQDVVKLLRNVFAYSDIQMVVYSLDEHATRMARKSVKSRPKGLKYNR